MPDHRPSPAGRPEANQSLSFARHLEIAPAHARPANAWPALVLLALSLLLAWLPVRPLAAAGIAWPTAPGAVNSAGRWPSLAEIPCGAYLVLNRTTGEVLLEKEPDLPLFPASTTKVLTALIALERLDPNQSVTLSQKAVSLTPNASRVGFKAGEQVYVRDLLAGLMLASGNDAANAVAEAVSGSEAAFALLMNERARQAGARHSSFVNPSGIHHEQHVTTARDLALITAEAMKNPSFRALVALESISMPATNMHPLNGWAIISNTNRLLIFGDSYLASPELKSVTGVKTGSTNQAGDNLVAAATTTQGDELVAVLLKAPISTADSNKFVSMRTLLETAALKAREASGGQQPTTTSSGQAPTSGTTAPSGTGTAGSNGPTGSGGTGPSGSSAPSGSNPGPSDSGPSASSVSTGSAIPSATATTPMTQPGGWPPEGGTPGETGMLEGLRRQLGISPAAFMTVSVLIGLLLGLGIGLVLVFRLHRATHRRTRSGAVRSSRPSSKR